MKKINNNQNGITLISLVIYIIVLVIAMAIMTTVSTYFYGNIGGIIDTPKYLSEFNKFAMFFVADVKDYKTATVTSDTVKFDYGPTYQFKDGAIYRDDLKIADYIINCTFSKEQPYMVDDISKNIINVDMQIGKSEEKSVTQNVDFVLKYW